MVDHRGRGWSHVFRVVDRWRNWVILVIHCCRVHVFLRIHVLLSGSGVSDEAEGEVTLRVELSRFFDNALVLVRFDVDIKKDEPSGICTAAIDFREAVDATEIAGEGGLSRSEVAVFHFCSA